MKKEIPTGLENSLDGRISPDIQAAIHVFATHWRKVNAAWTYPEHTHPLFEFNAAWQGKQRMTLDGKVIVQEEGDILFIRPGTVHGSEGSEGGGELIYFSLHFNIDDPSLRRSLLSMKETVIPAGSAISSTFHDIFRNYIELSDSHHAGRAVDRTLRESLLSLQASFRLFAALCEWALIREPAMEDNSPDSSHAIAKAIERSLHQSFTAANGEKEEPTGIERIASSLGYSPAYCNKVFKQAYGISPRQYLSELTIREAKLLLMDHSLTVEDIAYRFGYRDVSHFSKQFKRWTGISPLGYRRLSH